VKASTLRGLHNHLLSYKLKVCFWKNDFGWRQDNGNRSNQESKFDFLTTRHLLWKIDGGQQKIKIVRSNQQSNLRTSCQSIFSLPRHLLFFLFFRCRQGWCRQREKSDWQEEPKFDYRLERTIFIFCCPGATLVAGQN